MGMFMSGLSQTLNRCSGKAHQGYMTILTIGLTVFILLMAALSVDLGLYFTTQNQLQTAADSAVLAGASKLFSGTASTAELRQLDASDEAISYAQDNYSGITVVNDDIQFGYIDPVTLNYNKDTFTTPSTSADYQSTGGYNAMRITVRADEEHDSPIPTVFANLFGIHKMDTLATAVAIMDNKIGSVVAGGLRPIYACNAQYTLAQQNAQAKGMPLYSQTVQIYGDHFTLNGNSASCPLPGAGNWGFADFTDCDPGSPGNNLVSDWFANGYPGSIKLGQCYSTAPGNFLKSNEVKTALQTLIANKTIVLVPLISDFQGTGSNTTVKIVGYSGFVFTKVSTQGAASNWYVEGYFSNATCTTQCQGNPASIGGGVAKLRLIQ